jgi:hypothetical protein
MSQKEACQKLSSAVVQINAGGSTLGTGFIISPDGWMLTAGHVVLDESSNPLKAYSAISVTLPDGSIKLAQLLSPIDPYTVARDYAVLKVDGHDLPYFDIGDKPDEIALGSDLTMIGFPFSAVAFRESGPSVKDKFCLSATVAYSGDTNVAISGTTPKGPVTVNVGVDVIYFQGPSVKGLSGAPIISRDTGHVIAILTSKLTGISPAMSKSAKDLHNLMREGSNISMGPVHFIDTFSQIIDTLDAQLANGLGAGTGIEDVKTAYRHALRQRGINPK